MLPSSKTAGNNLKDSFGQWIQIYSRKLIFNMPRFFVASVGCKISLISIMCCLDFLLCTKVGSNLNTGSKRNVGLILWCLSKQIGLISSNSCQMLPPICVTDPQYWYHNLIRCLYYYLFPWFNVVVVKELDQIDMINFGCVENNYVCVMDPMKFSSPQRKCIRWFISKRP